jgi:hypothetical protein
MAGFVLKNLVPGNYRITGMLSESEQEDFEGAAGAAGENNSKVTLAEKDKNIVQMDLRPQK